MTTALLIVDPQNDFCDGPAAGALPVPGAWADMGRLAALVRRLDGRLDAIHVTLDSHHPLHIAHPVAWSDAQGAQPAPFTAITAADVDAGGWRAHDPALRQRYRAYIHRLDQAGAIAHTIWPPHCLIGSPGHAVQPELFAALRAWEERHLSVVDYVLKGSNPHVEHFGALAAQVPDPDDPATALNTALIGRLRQADRLLVAGEALNFCVMTTLTQLLGALPAAAAARITLLADCTSPVPVPGHEQVVRDFLADLTARGVTVANGDGLF